MKGALMYVSDKLLLRKRAIIETVNDELKNIVQVEHSRCGCFITVENITLCDIIILVELFGKDKTVFINSLDFRMKFADYFFSKKSGYFAS